MTKTNENAKTSTTMTAEFMTAYAEYLSKGTAADPKVAEFEPTPAQWIELRNAIPSVKEQAEAAFKSFGTTAASAACEKLIFNGNEQRPAHDIMSDLLNETERAKYEKPVMTLNSEGKWELDNKSRTLTFYQAEDWFRLKKSVKTDEKGNAKPNIMVSLAQDIRWDDYVEALLFNILAHNSGSKENGFGNSLELASPCTLKTRERLEMTKCGKKDLEYQIRLTLGKILPEELVGPINKRLVNYILTRADACKKGKSNFFTRKEMVDELFEVNRRATKGEDIQRTCRDRMFKKASK